MKNKIQNKKNEAILFIQNKSVFEKSNKELKNTSKNSYEKIIYKSKLAFISFVVFIIIIFQLFLNFTLFNKHKTNGINELIAHKSLNIEENYFQEDNNQEKLEEIDVDILNSIKDKLGDYIEMKPDEQRFFNGLIRKYKPKKIVEVGVSAGGSSALILNAIKDIPNAKLYSIDRYNGWFFNHTKSKGWLVNEKFPELMNKWTLYIGKNAAEVMESIGNNIDLAFIDTFHLTPGEMINWLEVLPFLKEEAIVVFHDAFLMFQETQPANSKNNYSNNQLLCYIRGTLILPSYGDEIFSRNIGATKLDKNQKKYYKHYFMALGNLWEGFPEEKDIEILRNHFKKYYNEKLIEIFDNAVKKNRARKARGIIRTIYFD